MKYKVKNIGTDTRQFMGMYKPYILESKNSVILNHKPKRVDKLYFDVEEHTEKSLKEKTKITEDKK